jgi:hypothetical protein
MKYTNHIKLSLAFPDEDIGVVDEMNLKEFFQSYLWQICNIFVADGHNGKTSGLVSFGVCYNEVWKTYSFSLCGGTHYEEIAKEVRDHFLELGYECGDFQKTWVVKHHGRPRADGVEFGVKQK